MNTEDIKIAKLNKKMHSGDCFYHDGHVYKKISIYKGWYRTGYEWVIDSAKDPYEWRDTSGKDTNAMWENLYRMSKL